MHDSGTRNTDPSDSRLDSWKAIASYLGRDVRTVRRWERSGLPIRRVPGGRGVFAYVSDIEQWLRSSEISTLLDSTPEETGRTDTGRRWMTGAVLGLTVVAAGVMASFVLRPSAPAIARIRLAPDAFVALDADGAERWRYQFPAGERPMFGPDVNAALHQGIGSTVIVGTALSLDAENERQSSGRLLAFTPRGLPRWSFAFDDQVAFGGQTYAAPWAITDYRTIATAAGLRTVVAAHHARWWPSLVTVLDEAGRRGATFAHAGWIESVRWASPTRVLIGGFSNSRDAGMVALLDASALDGHSPEQPGDFECRGCGANLPIRYVALPRTELNRVTGSPFNRAILELSGDTIIARSLELAQAAETGVADAVYEFSSNLELRRATLSDKYWDRHRALELQGLVHHTREQCPERDGPTHIEMWQSDTGWRSVPARH